MSTRERVESDRGGGEGEGERLRRESGRGEGGRMRKEIGGEREEDREGRVGVTKRRESGGKGG